MLDLMLIAQRVCAWVTTDQIWSLITCLGRRLMSDGTFLVTIHLRLTNRTFAFLQQIKVEFTT